MLNTGNLDSSNVAASVQAPTDLFQDMDLYFQDDVYERVYGLLWEMSYQSSELS